MPVEHALTNLPHAWWRREDQEKLLEKTLEEERRRHSLPPRHCGGQTFRFSPCEAACRSDCLSVCRMVRRGKHVCEGGSSDGVPPPDPRAWDVLWWR